MGAESQTPPTNPEPLSEKARALINEQIVRELDKAVGTKVAGIVEENFKRLASERQERTTAVFERLYGGGENPMRIELSGEPKHQLGAFLAAHTAGIAATRNVDGFERWHDTRPVEAAKKWAEDTFGQHSKLTERFYGMVEAKAPDVKRAMAAGEFQDGGQFIIGDVRDTFTDILRPAVVVFQLEPQTVPMPSGTMKLPRINATIQLGYQGEGQEPTPSKPTTGELSLVSRECAGVIPISNKLLRRGGPRVNQVIERLAVLQMGVVKDQALLRGPGTQFTPKGVYNLANSTLNVPQSPSFQQVLSTLGLAISTLEQANVNITKGGWVMNPRIKNYLMFSVVNALGVPYFLDELREGTLLGFKYGATTNVPSNLGTDGTNAPVLFADWNYVVYGDTYALNIKMSTEATYTENGSPRNAFELDQTLIRLSDEHDITIEHPEAAVVLGANTTGNGMSWA